MTSHRSGSRVPRPACVRGMLVCWHKVTSSVAYIVHMQKPTRATPAHGAQATCEQYFVGMIQTQSKIRSVHMLYITAIHTIPMAQ